MSNYLRISAVVLASLAGTSAWAQGELTLGSTTAAAVEAHSSTAAASVAELPTPSATPAPSASPTPEDSGKPADSEKGNGASIVNGATGFGGAGNDRPYYVFGLFQFRKLAVNSETPLPELGAFYRLELGYKPAPGWSVFGRVAATQGFVSSIDHPPFLFQDVTLGFAYLKSLPLDGLGLKDKALDIRGRAQVYLPTSVASQRQEMFLAPELGLTFRLEPNERWLILLDGYAQYRALRYAEHAGQTALMNVEWALATYLWINWTFLEAGEWGSYALGATISTDGALKYANEVTGRSPWEEKVGWSFSLSWTPASLPSVWLSLSIEQNGPIMRDGIVNLFLTKLEETEMVFTAGGRY
ncbi:MAG: hypothetical protein U1E65_34680 [Myxococcota bacterium]